MQEYQYRPLDRNSNQIRLLQVDKADETDAPLILQLRHAVLGAEDKFSALSYTWGEESPLFPILIREKGLASLRTLFVRLNLYEFLHAARRSSRSWGIKWIWIDQICINQEDHIERCHQVKQMHSLYSTAQATIIWPGRSFVDEDLALQIHEKRLHLSVLNAPDSEAVASPAVSGHLDPDAQRLLGMLTNGRFIALVATPYWERIWIIQEILLASSVKMDI